MINDINSKLQEKLAHLKSDKVKAAIGAPKKEEGQDGDVTIRRIESKLGLYGKFNNQWYKFTETDANTEISKIPEVAATHNSGLLPDHTSNWKEVKGSTSEISGVHSFGKLPAFYQLWFSPAGSGNFNKAYSVAMGTPPSYDGDGDLLYLLQGACSLECDIMNYVLRRGDSYATNASEAEIKDQRAWGWYWATSSTPIKIGSSSDTTLVGHFKLNLWK